MDLVEGQEPGAMTHAPTIRAMGVVRRLGRAGPGLRGQLPSHRGMPAVGTYLETPHPGTQLQPVHPMFAARARSFNFVVYGPTVPVRTTIGVCPYCEEQTLQKEVYDVLDEGAIVVFMVSCTVCNKDV